MATSKSPRKTDASVSAHPLELEFVRQWKRIGAPGTPKIRTPGEGEVTVVGRALPGGGVTFSIDESVEALRRMRPIPKNRDSVVAIDRILKAFRNVPMRSHRHFPRGFDGPEV